MVTTPDLSFTVHILSQFMANPKEEHLCAATRGLRYLKSAHSQGLFYATKQPLELVAYYDSDSASCHLTRRSVTGYAITQGSSLLSWKPKK